MLEFLIQLVGIIINWAAQDTLANVLALVLIASRYVWGFSRRFDVSLKMQWRNGRFGIGVQIRRVRRGS